MGRRKEIERHLSKSELDERIKSADDPKIVQRLIFVKNLYTGDTLTEAAERVGTSQPTGGRWADRWNEDGLDGLAPDWGDGRPSKLDDEERARLRDMLEADQPWTTQEILHLIEEEFDISYHPNYIYELLRSFDMHYAKPRPKRPERPDDAAEQLEEEIDQTIENDDDEDPVTDGGYVVGFFDAAGPQPTDNSRRVWAFDVPEVERELMEVDRPVLGFYALNGTSVATFTDRQTKEQICRAFERIRSNNPERKILLILDNFSSHTCEYTRSRAAELGIELVFLPIGSPHLNPIEPLWKSLRWEISPIAVDSTDEFRDLVRQKFDALTDKVSFATDWIDRFLDIQKLS